MESSVLDPQEATGLVSVLDLLPCMAFVQDGGRIVLQNELAALETCLDPEEAVLVERVFLGAFPTLAHTSSLEPVMFECVLIRQSGRPRVVQGAVRTLGDGRRVIMAMERRSGESEGESSFLGDILDSAPEAMAITHDGRMLHVNREFVRLFQRPAVECIGQDIDAMLLPDGRLHENEILRHMVATDGRASMETVRQAADGSGVDVSLLCAPVRLSGSTMGLFYTFRDIRRQKEEEARLHHNAMHDGLTGLANRALFLDRLNLTLARLRRRPDRHFAVMFMDLDRFKSVNDTMGHQAGDALLLEVTKRVRECVRPQDTVARFGGDEFAVLLDEVAARDDIASVAERIQATVQQAVHFEGKVMLVSASIGIALVTPEYRSAEEILRDADLAMYQAKGNGKAQHAFAPAAGDARMLGCLASPQANL